MIDWEPVQGVSHLLPYDSYYNWDKLHNVPEVARQKKNNDSVRVYCTDSSFSILKRTALYLTINSICQ